MQVIINRVEEPAGPGLKVDGWLEGAGVDELDRVVQSASEPVRLLLHDLRGADARGVALLRALRAGGAALEGLSAYLTLVLADPPDAAASGPTPVVGSETPVRRRHA
jgi:hypothetical protein